MIKVISFLILALAIHVGAEYCDKNTEYNSYVGRLNDGQSTGKVNSKNEVPLNY